MKIMKNNRLFKGLLMLFMVLFTTTSALAQVLKLTADKCFLAPGEIASVVVGLDNKDNLMALQGSVVLPEGLSFVTDEDNNVKTELVGRGLTTKKTDLFMLVKESNKQAAFFNCATLSKSGVEAGSGEIFTFAVKASKDLAISQTIKFEGIQMVTIDISEPIIYQPDFTILACNSEYKLDFNVDPIKVVPGKNTTISINLNFEKAILAGMQFDLVLPAGLKAVAESETVDVNRGPKHEANLHENGHFVVYSKFDPKKIHSFEGTTGKLCSFEVVADDNFVDGSEIQFNNIIASTSGSANEEPVPFYAPNLKVKVVKDGTATGINAIESDFAAKADGIYTISGLKVNQLVKGVNIVVKDGKATKVVKK